MLLQESVAHGGETPQTERQTDREGGRADREVFGGGWLRTTRREGERKRLRGRTNALFLPSQM